MSKLKDERGTTAANGLPVGAKPLAADMAAEKIINVAALKFIWIH